MSWLGRIFGMRELPGAAKVNPVPAASESGAAIPPERIGLTGEYDQSGLAKRVTLAFDQDPMLDDIETLWVAQTGGIVVLKGKVPNPAILDRMVAVAMEVEGATSVDTAQVTIE